MAQDDRIQPDSVYQLPEDGVSWPHWETAPDSSCFEPPPDITLHPAIVAGVMREAARTALVSEIHPADGAWS